MKKSLPSEHQAGPGGQKAVSDPEALDRQRVLGARLRTLFDDVVDEGVPQDFLSLLDKLGDDPEPR